MSAPANGPDPAHPHSSGLGGLVFAFMVVLCGAPSTVVLVREGDTGWAVAFGVATALALASLVTVAMVAIRTARAMRASRALDAARAAQAATAQHHARAGPPPVAVRVAAGLIFLTAAGLAVGAALVLMQGVRFGDWGVPVASVYAGVLGMLGFAEFLLGQTLLRRGFAVGVQIMHTALAAFFGVGIINGLISDSPDKWTAILALVGVSTYLALPAIVLATPAARAWAKRHQPVPSTPPPPPP